MSQCDASQDPSARRDRGVLIRGKLLAVTIAHSVGETAGSVITGMAGSTEKGGIARTARGVSLVLVFDRVHPRT